MHHRNYYVGVVLFGQTGDAISSLRERAAEAFGASRSNSPPHLTLFYPFEARDPRQLRNALATMTHERAPFAVPIEGYGAFDEAVWFLAPKPVPALIQLRQEVRTVVRAILSAEERPSRRDSPFHATVAQKYPPEAHPRIGAFLRGERFPRTATIDHLALFHRPTGTGRWHPIEIFFFKNTA